MCIRDRSIILQDLRRSVLLTAVTPFTVSYTHLDVYKRQLFYYGLNIMKKGLSNHVQGFDS